MSNSQTFRVRRAILAACVTPILALSGFAHADSTWTGSTSTDWNDATNWSSGVPAGTNAIINTSTGNVATISSSSTFTPVDIFVGLFSASATLNQTAGTASTGNGNWLFLGRGGTGTYTYNLANTATTGGTYTGYGLGSGSMTVGNLQIGDPFGNNGGGTAIVNVNTTGTLQSTGDINVGQGGALGTLNLDAGTVSVGGLLSVGSGNAGGGTGVVNQSGGTVTSSNPLAIANGVAATGTYNQHGGTVSVSEVHVGGNDLFGTTDNGNGTYNMSSGTLTTQGYLVTAYNGGNGTFNQTGGTVNAAVAYGNVTTTAGTGSFNVSGGTFNVGGNGSNGGTNQANLYVAEGFAGSAVGNFTVSGTGSVVVQNDVVLAVNNGASTGTFNLNGGSVQAKEIQNGGGAGTFNFNGGTLRAAQNDTAFMQGINTVNVRNGGAIIDTNGHSITVSQALTHSNILGDNATDGGLTVLGSGSLTLNSINTYTGGTKVGDGTAATNLEVATGGTLGSGNVTVLNNATLTLDVSNAIAATGNVNIMGTGFVNMDFNGADVINSLTVDGVLFGPGTYTLAFLSNSYGNNFGSLTNSNGEFVVAVPEPGTYGMLLGGLGLLYFTLRRRRVQS